jgi:hypothetical protein
MTDGVLPAPRRSGWLIAGLLLTVVALALTTGGIWYWLGGAMPTYTAAEERTYHHRIDHLVLDLDAGSISLIATAQPDTVAVTRQLSWSQRNRPSASEIWNGDTLHIERPRCVPDSSQCSAQYTIRLPAGTAVDASTGGGDIITHGMTADQRLTTGFGMVRVAGSGGSLDITDQAGDIIGTRLSSTDTTVSTNGQITLDFVAVPSTLDATSGGGDIDVAVPRAGDGGTDAYRVDTGTTDGPSATVEVAQNPAGRHALFIRADHGLVRVHY